MKTTSCVKNNQVHNRSNYLSSKASNRSIVKLADIAVITAGNPAPKKTEFAKEGKPFVRAGNLNELIDGVAVSNLEKLDDETAKQKKMKLFPAGTVIFAKSGMSCVTGNIYILPEPCYVVSHLACIITNKKLAEYLRYYFEFDKPCKLIENASFPSIRLGKISNMAIPLPADAEMLRQTAVLKYVDQLKRQYGLQLHTLDSLIKSRFVEMFGEEQRLVELSEVCETFNGDRSSNYPSADERINAGVPFVNAGNLANGAIAFNNMEYVSEEKYHQLSGGRIQTGDLLYCLRGSLGKCALADFDKGTIASSLMIIRCNQERIQPKYLYEAMVSPFVERQMVSANNGSSQPNLSAKSVKQFKIPLPPLALQQEFAAFVAQVDKLRFATQQQIDKLETLKKSLMQEYFG